ncbi:MAG: DUF4160 domain-containing protein [Chloroflexota bacterium]
MPVVLRVNGYKFWFYEADMTEPPHLHVGKEGKEAKFWLNPIREARAGRFKPFELRQIKQIIEDNHAFLLTAWESEKSRHVNG